MSITHDIFLKGPVNNLDGFWRQVSKFEAKLDLLTCLLSHGEYNDQTMPKLTYAISLPDKQFHQEADYACMYTW